MKFQLFFAALMILCRISYQGVVGQKCDPPKTLVAECSPETESCTNHCLAPGERMQPVYHKYCTNLGPNTNIMCANRLDATECADYCTLRASGSL